MKKRKKIDFKKLLDGSYDLPTQLNVFNWMLATGKRFATTHGMDKLLYGNSVHPAVPEAWFGALYRAACLGEKTKQRGRQIEMFNY